MLASEKRIVSTEQEIASLRDEIARLKNENQYYREQIDVLKRIVFGAKSEKSKTIAINAHQLHFFEFAHFDQNPSDDPKADPKTDPDADNDSPKKPRKKYGRRRVSPEILSEEIVISALDDQKKDENGNPLALLGYEISERLHIQSSKLVRQIIKREKYGHKDSRETEYTAPVPPSIMPKGKLSDSFVIYVLTQKFFVGTPLYRLIRSLNVKGADLAKSTLSDVVQAGGKFFSKIAEEIRTEILSSKYVHMDETPIKNQKKKELDFFWVCRNRHHCYVHYGDGRSGDEAMTVLSNKNQNSRGSPKFIMADDYGGYNQACDVLKLIRMACWAHVRRKYYDTAKNGNEISQRMLALIKQLYNIESAINHECKKNEWDKETFWRKRKEARQHHSKVIIEEIADEVEKHVGKTLPASSLGKALAYTQNVMKNLKVYLTDGELPIDNNPAEQAIRLVVIGRKNYIFVGSKKAGIAAATCYTLTESCRMNKIDPEAYLAYITRIFHEEKQPDLKNLTPFALRDKIRSIPVNF
jgi:transposase